MCILEKPTILVIDDDPMPRKTLNRILTRLGYPVIEASNGKAGLQMLAENEPGLIMLDNDMPGMQGIEVLAKIRQSHPNLPVIMMSGAGDDMFVSKVLKMGAMAFLAKPFDLNELKEAIATGVLPLNVCSKYSFLFKISSIIGM